MAKFAIPIIFLGVIFYARVYPAKEIVPCTELLRYSVGVFDRRFGLSYEGFLRALSKAEAVWESASGIELFTYDPETSGLPVNLVYDYRQEVTDELSKIESAVENSEASYRTLERDYLMLKGKHAELEALYQARKAVFDEHNAAYSQNVEEWNKSSRINKSQFDALQAEREALESEFSALKVLENELNKTVRDVNMAVDRLNRLAGTLNLNVEEYNTIGASRGETFAGGLYITDATGERIDIYEFSNHEKLVRVLAHELGHALGLEHISDKGAIMYYLNESDAGKPSAADIDSLKTLCKIN